MSEIRISKATSKVFAELSTSLGVQSDFLERLFTKDDDWSFVVKGHALLESAVCAWIAAHLGRPEIETTLADNVQMSARIDLLSSLKLGTSEQRGKLRVFGKLRNKLVHNAQETGFTFSDYLSDKTRRDAFVKDFRVNLRESEGHTVSVLARVSLFSFVAGVVGYTVNEKKRADAQRLQSIINAAIMGTNPGGSPE